MTFKTLLRAGSVSTVAAALALGALPAAAQDDDRQGPETRSGDRIELPQRAERAEARQQRREQRAERQQQQPAQARPERAQRQDWNRGDRRSDTAVQRQRSDGAGREWNRRDNTNNDWGQARAAQVQAQAEARRQARAQAPAQAQAQAGAQAQRWDGRRQGGIEGRSNTGGWERNRSYGDRDRNRTYRDGYRDGRQRDEWRDRNQQQNAYRSGYRDGVRTDGSRWDGDRDGRRYSGDYRRWNDGWRRDNRYNWYSYRNHNRDVFRLGRYYSPYSNYRYSRLSIGFRLGSLFYGSRYWINDPWQYRLPAAYGPYRWVRYYDDALLVDIYTGEVVDVIYDFFW